MSDEQGDASKTVDPKPADPKANPKEVKAADLLEPWRQVRDSYLDFWSKNMVEAVNSEAYAQATGTLLDTALTTSAPFREALEKSMTAALQQMSMPTRADVVSVAERMTNLEMRLDDMDIKLDHIARLLSQAVRKQPAPPTDLTDEAEPLVSAAAATTAPHAAPRRRPAARKK